ncbi:primosomal protein N' [Lentisphaerota bacterium WC36G]|nr:primosomal protein N' [Lentisphaerae bacterium WC36]
MKNNIARVALLNSEYEYLIPDELLHVVHEGSQVYIPFGKSKRRGHIVKISNKSEFPVDQLKSIIEVYGKQALITPQLLKLGDWMAQYYCCSKERAMRTLLPGSVRNGKVKHQRISHYFINDSKIAEEFLVKNKNNKNRHLQCEALKVLLTHNELVANALISESGCSTSTIKSLLKNDLIGEEKRVVQRDPFANREIIRTEKLALMTEQQTALQKINQLQDEILDKKKTVNPHTVLLFGVTGSGKTEVYLQAIDHCINLNKEAIVLVPEIALTPQTVSRFRARFGDEISVLHSGLSDGERFDEWSKVSNGTVKIAVGARSALFAPFKNLGLIIVDEEHEGTYKQSEAPRYHARDVAVMRGHLENAVVVLGSATPSFESYNNALNGKYVLAILKQRVDDRAMPEVKIIDLRMDAALNNPQPTKKDEEDVEFKSSFFSNMLIDAVREKIHLGEQVILFLNRRGFARQMMCEQCGYVAMCPNCSIAYTYHKAYDTLCCHMCMDTIQALDVCPDCQSKEVRYSGLGTEKVEEIARKLFKGARIARMDSDTMRGGHKSYEAVLNKFSRGEIDVLIGTQMIAKGLHVERVTLVGILNADHGLYIPDFRAGERTFQLITQVAGRAGRGDMEGEVLIQSHNPFNETIQYAKKHDYVSFYEYDMEVRNLLSYPPNGHLIAVYFEGEDNDLVANVAKDFANTLQKYLNDSITVSEVGVAPIERIKKKFRYMTMYRGTKLKAVRGAIRHLILHNNYPKKVHIYADVDAVSLL